MNEQQKQYLSDHEYIFEIKNRILHIMQKEYEKYGFEEKQCNIIFGQWLSSTLFNLYYKYKEVQKGKLFTIDSYKEFDYVYSPRQSCILEAEDKQYNDYLLVKMCEKLGVNVEKKSACSETTKVKKTFIFKKILLFFTNFKNIIRYKKQKYLQEKKYFHFEKHGQITCHSLLLRTFLPSDKVKNIVRKSNGKVCDIEDKFWFYLDEHISKCYSVDYKKRNDMLASFLPENNFEEAIKGLIPEIFPIAWLEDFETYYLSAKKCSDRYNADKIYTACFFPYGSIVCTIFAAIKSAQGVKIYDIQHSFIYAANHTMGFSEYQVYDEFLSWGWVEKNPYCDIRPLTSTRFSKQKELRKGNGNHDILLVVNDMVIFENGSGCYCKNYIDRHMKFINELDENLRSRVTVRVRADVVDLKNKYSQKYPEVKFENMADSSLSDSMERSDLIIVDHMSSTFIEAIAAKKPIMVYNANEYAVYNSCMSDYIQKLYKCDIYRDTGEEIAKLLNNGEISIMEKMWEDSEKSNILNEFMSYFMGDVEKVEEIWLDEFIN